MRCYNGPVPATSTPNLPSGNDDRLAAAERGENPAVLARMISGFAVIGDTQHLPGYCLLLYSGHADHLTDLNAGERIAFLTDMTLLGEAVEAVCRARDPQFRRINYEILGNSWPHLHAHVHPRYDWEPLELRTKPVWLYPDRHSPHHRLGEKHAELRASLTEELARRQRS